MNLVKNNCHVTDFEHFSLILELDWHNSIEPSRMYIVIIYFSLN
jgi:hypothetical protein